jgi:hypothetical protein
MKKNLQMQLELRKMWLEDENKNYSKDDFKEDWQKLQGIVMDAQFMELISRNVYEQCRQLLTSYIDCFLVW